jgi:hypothetical protein
MHSALRSASLAVTGALALCGAVAGCSALLDWKGYAGGQAPADGEGGSDAGDAGDASSADVAMPLCGPGNCGGCCNPAGYCAGGQSKSTCGTGGHACTDCTPAGNVCSAGACVAPAVDAAPPPPCNPMSCFVACAPVYQTSCCKSDGTCGCQVQIPELGPCM